MASLQSVAMALDSERVFNLACLAALGVIALFLCLSHRRLSGAATDRSAKEATLAQPCDDGAGKSKKDKEKAKRKRQAGRRKMAAKLRPSAVEGERGLESGLVLSVVEERERDVEEKGEGGVEEALAEPPPPQRELGDAEGKGAWIPVQKGRANRGRLPQAGASQSASSGGTPTSPVAVSETSFSHGEASSASSVLRNGEQPSLASGFDHDPYSDTGSDISDDDDLVSIYLQPGEDGWDSGDAIPQMFNTRCLSVNNLLREAAEQEAITIDNDDFSVDAPRVFHATKRQRENAKSARRAGQQNFREAKRDGRLPRVAQRSEVEKMGNAHEKHIEGAWNAPVLRKRRVTHREHRRMEAQLGRNLKTKPAKGDWAPK